ncbi:SdrD B-like domain-containing protein [Salana multivorans]|uniref:SdrD B-like domain-containing protein n=1 Tax=Salana multivorans TaxID=120377 RepID=UPI0024927BAE|nr:SdrD B-like domain-containing protein [Salana multivorans]
MTNKERTAGRWSGPNPRRWLSSLVALVLAMASVVGLSQAASADPAGISSNVLLNGETYDGTAVVKEGDTLTLRVQYNDAVAPGSTVVFELGDNVTLTGVPAGNSAIVGVVQDGNKVSITFANPWPTEINQGVFDLDFKVNPVDGSVKEPITWKVGGDEHSVTVIIRNDGDQFENVTDTQAKSVTPGNLDSFVTVVGGEVKLKPEIADQELTYTLRVDSPTARTGYTIADQLPAGLGYVAGSFVGSLTTWDANGLNRTTSPFTFSPTVSGSTFSGSVDVAGPSSLALTYKVKVTDVAALEALLQTKYDALAGGSGNFEISQVNTATFGGEVTRTASVRLRGNVPAAPGPNLGQAFAKNADWATKNVVTGEDGTTLTPPADIVYTLRANLAQWNDSSANFTLSQNVVISDVLPAQARWNGSDAAFVTAEGITLTRAAACPATTADFAADAYVGQYCLDGQRLLVNVGKDSATNATIQVKAQLLTVDGLEQTGSTSITDAVPYRLRNTANFHYRDGSPYGVNRDVTVVVLPDTSGGVNDSTVFAKSGTAEETTVKPGETVTVNYRFTVAAGKGIDLSKSTIVDYVDTDVFSLEDLSAIGVTGTYDGQALTAAHFVLSTNADGDLVIALSETGKAVVEARGADKAFVANLALTSTPFVGKETRTITNRATLFGEDGDPDYWSETEEEATSYGDEAEVRKRVYDRSAAQWVETLKAYMDGEGNLVQDTYVYRIEFIPHGSYDSVKIIDVVDILPGATEFLGFVTQENAATAADPTNGPVDIGGNLEATYDAASKTVKLVQKDGTVLDAGPSIAAYVAVRVTDPSQTVVNRIGGTSATIEPVKSVSVGDYVWVDQNRDGRQDEGEPGIPGVVLTLVGPDGEPVTDVFGNPVPPTPTDENGHYTFENLPALTGEQTYTVVIDRQASQEALRPYVPTVPGEGDREGDSSTWEASTEPGDLHEDGDRDPTLDFGFVTPSVSVGDYVWVDQNRDGRQDEGEPGIPGVVLTLVGPDGEPVTDVFGNPVPPTPTDENGHYTFENLPALTGEQTYTVVIDRQASQEALRPYVPTVPGEGDREGDSSTWEASTEPGDLHEDGDRDPTLDFGFVAKTYAIGDVVWIDANKNGVQDDGEKPLPGVTVDLLVDGDVVATTTTDADGRYVFDNLPAGTYQVRFTLTQEQKAMYEFTVRDAGDDDAVDSDANPSDGLTRTIVLDDSNEALTGEYPYREIAASQGIDPTWDAGVVLKPAPSTPAGGTTTPTVPPATPTPSPSHGPLPNTGSGIGVGAVAAVLALLGAGGTLLLLARRRDAVRTGG